MIKYKFAQYMYLTYYKQSLNEMLYQDIICTKIVIDKKLQ